MSFNVCGAFARFSGALVVVLAGAAQGAMIVPGTYELHNHPDGSARPPLYGLRLDELVNVTSNHDIFTFDFDHPSSAMFLDYTGSTVRIYGQTYGGRDTGSSYAADSHLGVYVIDFIYTIGVGLEPGDDDVVVNLPPGDSYNYGTIEAPSGQLYSLRDGHYDGAQRDFRFGDTDNDLGHRGFAGLSGWGWLFHAPVGEPYGEYVANSDWLFTAELVPAPGVGTMALVGGAMMMRRRRGA